MEAEKIEVTKTAGVIKIAEATIVVAIADDTITTECRAEIEVTAEVAVEVTVAISPEVTQTSV